MALRQLETIENFPFRTFDKLRYADMDTQGHINNAVFSTFLETGRVDFLYDLNNPLTADNASFVIANLNLNFLAEIRWPGQVDIGTAVLKVGNSSLSLYQALFQSGHCVATAETVIVQMDNASRKSCPLTDKAKTYFARHMLVG